ncbi:class I glutamine amidotransferase-like protein [Pavlovales sp. CCMP2436]|nr:class I glutamine amidotransferase-like protein [Pavlovales sp. CCMP2436]
MAGDEPQPRTLIVDNYDSFTYNLLHMLAADEAHFGETVLVRNDEFGSWADVSAALGPFARVVLSPGPGNPTRASDFGLCASVIAHAPVPVLGVCLGHQGIGAHLGARVVRAAAGPMHGRLEAVTHAADGAALFAGVPASFTAVRYHSLELEPTSLPPQLRATAWAADRVSIMAVESLDGRLHGLQFHPESICSQHGQALLRNFAKVTLPGQRWDQQEEQEWVSLLVDELEGPLAETVAADPADSFVMVGNFKLWGRSLANPWVGICDGRAFAMRAHLWWASGSHADPR